MDVVYRHQKEQFTRFLTHEEIRNCASEIKLMELVSSTIKMPRELKKIPRYSVYAEGRRENEFIAATTKDTLIQLVVDYSLPVTKYIISKYCSLYYKAGVAG